MHARSSRAFERQAAVLDVWEIDLARPISEADRALLNDEETAKADRIIIEPKRRQSYRARAELRRILGLYLDADPREPAGRGEGHDADGDEDPPGQDERLARDRPPVVRHGSWPQTSKPSRRAERLR